MAMSIFLSLLTFVKFVSPPGVAKSEFDRLDNELKIKFAPLHREISQAPIENPGLIQQLGDQLTCELRDFFVKHNAFFEHEAAKVPSKEYVSHKNSTIAQVEATKKQLRQEAFGEEGSEEKRKEFYDCLKALGELKEIEKRKQLNKTVAYQFYTSTYSNHRDIDFSKHTWFPQLPTSPESITFTPFNTSPIRPRDIKNILGKSNKKSAPGPDGISYSVLFKLESTHHILSTYFTKVIVSDAPPPSLGESVVKLIYNFNAIQLQDDCSFWMHWKDLQSHPC